MSVIALVNSKKFKKKSQFKKRKLVREHILKEENCKIGLNVMCFEIENIVADSYQWSYNKINKKFRKNIQNMTIGSYYKIINFGKNKVKLKNDIGVSHWYSVNRFLNSIQMERQEKLYKLNANYNVTKQLRLDF